MNGRDILGVARRYSFAWGRGYLSSFLSSLSMLGLVLAIALLITVLSVMNGFDKEMRERILSLVPHITLYSHRPMADWEQVIARLQQHPQVLSVTPFVRFEALFMQGQRIETAQGLGLDLQRELAGGALFRVLPPDQQQAFADDPGGLVLGSAIAERLGATPGDSLTLIVPGRGSRGLERAGSVAPTRFETLTLRAVLETGTELDQSAALLHLPLAAALAGLDGEISGLRIATRDIFRVSRTAGELTRMLPAGFYASTWMMTHGNLYSAIQLSRDLVSILLFSIIAVAAFNVVSSLVLVVLDKRGDIAILRTLGATPANIAWIFVCQGALIGAVGVALGSLLGVCLSLAVPGLVAWLEQLLDYRFLSTDVYPVSYLPVDVLASDVLLVGGVAFAMCVLAAIYPALRAAALAPAAILHAE